MMMEHLALIAAGLLLPLCLLYFFLLDPLRSVPGPFLARCSSLWLLTADLSGYRSHTIHSLHKQYGPVVRIGPQEVSFSSRQAMRDLYGANTVYMKAPIYGAYGRKSLFTMQKKEEHRARAKRVGHVFAPASISQVEPIVSEQLQKLLQKLSARLDQPLDVLLWFRMTTLDTFGSITPRIHSLLPGKLILCCNRRDILRQILWSSRSRVAPCNHERPG